MISAKVYEMLKKTIDEDAVVGAAPAGGGEVVAGDAADSGELTPGSKGTGVEDVLGKDCDHHKDGYLGPKCFHVPARCGKLQKRIELPGTKKKKGQKNPYLDGMKQMVLNEEDLNIYRAIHNLNEDDIYDFLTHCTGIDAESLWGIDAIVKVPGDSSTVVVKFKSDFRSQKPISYYVEAEFDGKKLKPTANRKAMTTAQAKELFISKAEDLGNEKLASMKIWVMWGNV